METFWCPSTSFAASSPLICTEVDFDDVFGGPPRRFFAKEGRFNFHSDVGGLAEDRLRKRGNDERRRVSASMIRKKLSVDFFDDEFTGNDFDGSRSASTHSSLLVELGKGMKVPASSSISHTPGTPSSRLLTYVRQSWKDTTTEEELCDGKTHLYVEFSLTSDGTVKILKNVIDDDEEEDIVNQKSAVRPRDNSVKKFLNNYNSNHDLDMKMKKAAESNQSDANKISVPSNTEEINGRKMVNEKVKELVAMFDKNRSFNSKLLAETLSQSSDGNDRSAMAVKKHKPETKPIVVENLKIDESGNGDSGNDPRTLVHNNTSVQHSDDSSPGSVPGSYRDENESFSDPLDEFEVKELRQEHGAESQTDEYQLAGTQESDAKIRKWSSGKQGNIRSLLSTMQHVLWPESGWKPVALVDIIETNQVKKIYQRALLYVHPDKLQQKGVSEQQRYIADKVFDILQVLSGAARMAFILLHIE